MTDKFLKMPWVSTMKKAHDALNKSHDPDDAARAAKVKEKINSERKRLKQCGEVER